MSDFQYRLNTSPYGTRATGMIKNPSLLLNGVHTFNRAFPIQHRAHHSHPEEKHANGEQNPNSKADTPDRAEMIFTRRR